MKERSTNEGGAQIRSRFVVPRRNVQTLCTIKNGQLIDLHPVPVPANAACVMSRHGWIAWADPDDLNPIYLWHCDAEPGREEFPSLHVPGDQAVESLAFRGNDLWIAGWRAGFLAMCPLDSPTRRLVEITTLLTDAITHLEFSGSRLYVTNDDGKQKRLWRLATEPNGRVAVEASIDLPRRNQDGFLGIAAGASWVAVLEWTFSFCEESCHLRLFHPETLASLEGSERISVMTNSLFVYPDAGCPIEGAADWKSLAWMGDVLLLASGPRGVGFLDLRRHASPMPLDREIRYVTTPGKVERVVPCMEFGMMLAVLTTAEGMDTVAIDLPTWATA